MSTNPHINDTINYNDGKNKFEFQKLEFEIEISHLKIYDENHMERKVICTNNFYHALNLKNILTDPKIEIKCSANIDMSKYLELVNLFINNQEELQILHCKLSQCEFEVGAYLTGLNGQHDGNVGVTFHFRGDPSFLKEYTIKESVTS